MGEIYFYLVDLNKEKGKEYLVDIEKKKNIEDSVGYFSPSRFLENLQKGNNLSFFESEIKDFKERFKGEFVYFNGK